MKHICMSESKVISYVFLVQNYIVEDILMLRNHIAVYGINNKFKYKIVLIDKNGEQYVVPEGKCYLMRFLVSLML